MPISLALSLCPLTGKPKPESCARFQALWAPIEVDRRPAVRSAAAKKIADEIATLVSLRPPLVPGRDHAQRGRVREVLGFDHEELLEIPGHRGEPCVLRRREQHARLALAEPALEAHVHREHATLRVDDDERPAVASSPRRRRE